VSAKIIKTPGKINLFLKIISRNQDGFHNLESVFAFVDIFDELKFNICNSNTANPKLNINFIGDYAKNINNKDNIITKIFSYFCKHYSINKNISLQITKNIPVGAGLGGGSSNGAFFMMLLNREFNIGLKKEELREISFNFGSDLAFFFENKSSIIRNIGTVDSHISEFISTPFLLVNPQINLATKEVFSSFKNDFSQPVSNEEILQSSVIDIIKKYPNQLEKIAEKKYPEITNIINFLYNKNPIKAKMTGSGSTCFAIFKNSKDLDKAYNSCLKEFPNYFVRKSNIIYEQKH